MVARTRRRTAIMTAPESSPPETPLQPTRAGRGVPDWTLEYFERGYGQRWGTPASFRSSPARGRGALESARAVADLARH